MDKLEEILLAVETKSAIEAPASDWPTIQMISWRTFSRVDYQKIRWFQANVAERFSVHLVALGGGYGCTKIIFAVEASNHQEAKDFIIDIMGRKEFSDLGVEAEFRVAISNTPYIRTDLRSGEQQELSLEAKEQKAINIYTKKVSLMTDPVNITRIEGGVRNSNLAIGSTNNTLQLNHQPESKALIALLSEMRNTVSCDSSLSNKEKQDALDRLDAATEEANKEHPKKSLLKTYAESLKSVESIGGSVVKLLGLLGIGT